MLKEPTISTPPPVLNFSATTSTSSTPNLTGSSTPTGTSLSGIPPVSTKAADDAETNPFWDGGRDKANEVVKLPHGVAGPQSSVFPPIPKTDMPAEPASAPATASEPPFSFGKPVEVKAPAASSTPAGPFSFGQAAEDKPASLAPFPFGKPEEKATAATTAMAATSSAPSLSFAFGQPVAADMPSASAGSFGTPAEAVEKEETAPAAPKPPFGAPTGSSNLFGEVPKPAMTGLLGEKGASQFATIPPPQSTPSPLPFTFGPPATSGATPSTPAVDEVPKPTFAFGSTAHTTVAPPAVELSAPKPLFGNSTFAFGQEKKEDVKSSLFPFGATPSTTPTVSEAKPASTPVFTFGQSATTTPTPTSTTPAGVSFSFSGGGSAGTDVTNKPSFIFGVPASTATLLERPVTPPKGHDLDLRMEESPVREMQVNGNGKAPEARPAIGSTAPFSFGGAGSSGVNGSSLFGAQGGTASSTSPFTFGVASSASSNPFAPKKPEESKPFGGFGAPQAPPINTSFSFGQQQPEENRPSSAGALFAFGQTPTSATNPTPTFAFGGANASSNPFGAATGSAPASPSTFAQPSSFSFGATSATNSNAFAFGSQPSSPAAAANATLPPPAGNATGFGQTPSPSSPFTAPLPLATSTSGGALFTIGAAPPTGQRQIKKLPRRAPVKR